MPRRSFRLSCLSLALAASACATPARTFPAIGNCWPSSAEPAGFGCLNAAGKSYSLPWIDAGNLICFDRLEFKAFNEACHQ